MERDGRDHPSAGTTRLITRTSQLLALSRVCSSTTANISLPAVLSERDNQQRIRALSTVQKNYFYIFVVFII